jgi:hypothetical protein
MPRYVLHNPKAQNPQPVIGWYDTDNVHRDLTRLPPTEHLVEVTDDIWDRHLVGYQRPNQWVVDNGVVVETDASAIPPVKPPLPPHVVITSATKPELNHAFALDAAPHIGDLARDAVSGVGLPGGQPTVGIPSMDGTIHDFSGEQVVALYKVLRDTKHNKVIGKPTEDTAEIP